MFEGLTFNPGMAFNAASTVMSMMGQSKAGDAALAAARRKKMAYDSQAAQLDINAGQQVASAQRAAEDERYQASLLKSRALALAAASGGGASDPTIVNLMAKLSGRGEYNSETAMYQGQEKARGMTDQARMARYSGDVAMADGEAAKDASRLSMVSTLLNGASSLYTKYGQSTDPSASNGFGYNGTWTADGPFDIRTYNKQIWD